MQTPLQFVQHTWQIVASACNATRCNDEVPSPSTSMIALEDRVLYDASPLAGILVDINESLETLGDANEDLTEYLVEETAFADFSIATNDSFTLGEDSKQLTFDPGRQLLVIDERLDNLDALIEDIYSQHPSATSFDIVRINQDSDGIAKITEALETGNKYDAIHIVAHGSEAKLQLGSVTLSQDNLSEYTSSLSRWTTGMSLGADILIYGCDVAATDEGHQFVDQISILTGADVAASDNLTGHSSLGGDWVFEYTAGLIETDLVFSAEIQTSYFGTFATVTVDNTLDVVNGATTSIANLIASDGGDGISLREAIIAANADGVADTIILGSGTYGLSLAGSGDELGDLNIINDVEIIGQVDGSSIVDARGIDRVFHVGSNSLTLSRLTVTGGSTTSLGGGIYVSGGSLTARDVIIEGNATSLNGGGIGVLGAMFATTLDLDGVTIRSNTSGSSGGGLNINDTFSQVTATVSGSLVYGNVANIGGAISVGGGSHTISNTTITDNTSLSGSGGIYTAAATVDLVHVTIADNTNLGGADSGGGGLTVANGTVSVQNSIIAGNTSGDAIEISGVINSLGNNIIGDDLGDSIGGVGYDLGSDLLNQTGLDLAPLQDNGGRVQTMELNSGSVGIDGANNAASPETDGRGYFRSDGQADIGAFERGAAANLEQDLVGHFQFDYDSVTTAVDSSVTANDGTWKNGVATVGNGPVGEAGDFEDPSRYVTIGSNAAYDFGAQDFSIALWYKAGPQPTSTTLLDKIGPFSGGNGDTAGVLIRATSTGSLSAFVEGQTGAFVFLPTTFDTTETWHHITLTRSGDVFRFYVDGVEVGTQTNAIGSVDNTSGIRLGEDDSVTSDEYVGQLDDVRFYSRALSEGRRPN